ncbi:hypothetical protein [Halospeciosus flavus]|uniref:hypothetical protein n=1 Tax=Halospeciosus flavus TaxID=3032283 RepID=UPI00362405E1
MEFVHLFAKVFTLLANGLELLLELLVDVLQFLEVFFQRGEAFLGGRFGVDLQGRPVRQTRATGHLLAHR